MVGTEKLLATGHVTGCCPAYISGRRSVLSPLAKNILEGVDKRKKKKRIEANDE